LLVNVWATWCGSCRLELPYVQKLHERLKNRSDLAIVTLDSDAATGLVAPYMEENGFDFPVLLAEPFLRRHFGDLRLPITWIIGTHGVVRRKHEGFSPDSADGWVDEALRQLESVAGTMPSASRPSP
jgi:thiol-disulfide isomerase/thioredoxin